MKQDSPYHLIAEMLETPDILRSFDEKAISGWTAFLDKKKELIVSGEGSSRIFPAKNMIARAREINHNWRITTDGARQVAEYDLSDKVVMGASSSGRTRELMALFEKAREKNVDCIGITATPHSPITGVTRPWRILSCGVGQAVAATKSVFETALYYQSLLGGDEWARKEEAANMCDAVLRADVPADIAKTLANAPVIYFAGRNDGVAEELTLKACEITRQKSLYLEGTYALHGVEEVMQKGETLVVIEPFAQDIEKYKTALQDGAEINIIAIAHGETPFPTIHIPKLAGFDRYFQLLAGWNLLVAAGLANAINLDTPKRARKVGNG